MKKTILLLCTILLSVAAFAQQQERHILNFESNMFKECGDTATIDGFLFRIDSLGSSCYFGNDEEQVWLYPCTLEMTLPDIGNTITSVTIEYTDWCRPECTTAASFDDNGEVIHTMSNEISNETDSFVFTEDLDRTRAIRMTSYEGYISRVIVVEEKEVDNK